jgi:carbamoyltransferase
MGSILGLCAFTHDSAAALVVNGRLIGFVEEERLNGIKHTNAYPHHAVAWLLDEAGIDPEQVDAVAYNFDPNRYTNTPTTTDATITAVAGAGDEHGRERIMARQASFRTVGDRTRTRITEIARRFSPVLPVEHHRAHALVAFASSSYEDAAVLVVDSIGEIQTTSIGQAHRATGGGCHYTQYAGIDDPASLGYAYGAVTEHLGWRRGDEEGTVMALAALGDPGRFRTLMAEAIPLTDTGFALDPRWFALRVLSSGYRRITDSFTAATCPPRVPDDPIEPVHADLAAALQERTEHVMVHLARRTRQLTRSRLLCLGGGVATNCVAVGRIAETGLFDEIHVAPAPGDSGTALGAAIAAHLDLVGTIPDGVAGQHALGPSFPGLILPTTPRPGLHALRLDNPAAHLARELAAGKIVGLFQGALEAGPRALGHRSILASPLQPDVAKRLNEAVKFREPFRPFAPVILSDAACDYVALSQPSPTMSIAAPATALARAKVPAIVHGNGTTRVQTLTRDQDPFLAGVLASFAAITGIPVLINTSLNIKGQPICGTPDLALDCLQTSGLDALLIEGWWVTRC